MRRNVYSVVLTDEIVDGIDRAARDTGLSRSQFIDRVLAEHLGMALPDRTLSGVITALDGLFEGVSGFSLHTLSQGSISLKTVLNFRYSPSVRYTVLPKSGEDGSPVFELRVFIRSQNASLLSDFAGYMNFYRALVVKYLGESYLGSGFASFLLPLGENAGDANASARLIADYITNLDGNMRKYFAAVASGEPAELICECDFLKNLMNERGKRL